MLLFKKYTMNIHCSKERLLQTLESKVYPCSMARFIFPLNEANKPLVGVVSSNSIKLRYGEEWNDGIRIPRGLSPILRGKIISTEDDCCAVVYRFLPDCLLFPFIILWLTGMLYLILQRRGCFYFLLPILPLPPFFILTGLYSTCSAETEKHLKELIQTACQADKSGSGPNGMVHLFEVREPFGSLIVCFVYFPTQKRAKMRSMTAASTSRPVMAPK